MVWWGCSALAMITACFLTDCSREDGLFLHVSGVGLYGQMAQ